MESLDGGTLFIVSTPIGNLGDLSPRAIETLSTVDLIACEDSRRTGLLLSHLGLKKKLLSLHEHNELARIPIILERLREGASVALVSDAGMPLLSDPGYPLVRECLAAQFPVATIPGASALTAALVVSGLPPHPFTFLGFAPPKSAKRRRFFARFEDLGHTMIYYESPRRLLHSLGDALQVLGDRPASVSRELTKLHEETLRGSLAELIAALEQRPEPKGEVVVVVGGAP